MHGNNPSNSVLGHKSDILVIGGGPAGSTAAALLSQMGWRVTLLEREQHPRFHIGESLLPGNIEILDRLGVTKELEKLGVAKYGADFTLSTDDCFEFFDFSRVKGIKHRSAFQVRRSEFDHMLLKNAAAKGVEVLEGIDAVEVQFKGADPVLVSARNKEGIESQWSAKFLIDATGRDTFVADKLRLKSRNPRHNSAAIFSHFSDAEMRPDNHAGNTSVYWFEHGWFWFIPLADGIASVGVVCTPAYLKTRTTDRDQFLWNTIKDCPPLARRLRNAKPSMEAKAAGNYSYAAKEMYGDNFLLIGDAYGFIDPVFSSGVFLAMFGGDLGAKTVDACLRKPVFKRYYLNKHARIVQKGIERLSWLIYRFTDPTMQDLFMNPTSRLKIKDSIISILAGDIFYKFRLTLPLFLFKGIYHAKRILGS
jgi:flavin-dependent dehydrogenase